MGKIKDKSKESLSSILPVSAIVLLLSITAAPLGSGILTLFLFGILFLILGMGLFTLGAEMSMQPLGEGIGIQMSRTKKRIIVLICCFVLGMLVTIAEPDLKVLAGQVPSIPNSVLVLTVAAGVGLFLAAAILRTVLHWKLSALLLIFYPLLFILAVFVPRDFIPVAFDSGGVTTGPITVPFIMALGAGLASVGSEKHGGEDSFGLVSLCSIGPILSVMILSLCFSGEAETAGQLITEAADTRAAFLIFLRELPEYAKEVMIALLPIGGVFLLFQLLFRRFRKRQIVRILIGMLYTYIGLVLFLTGANVGFMPVGSLLGKGIAVSAGKWLLVPVGMIIGYYVVEAEPAVYVLKKQVEEISNGAITQKAVGRALAIGVGLSVGISMLRVLTGIPLFPFLLIGYALALGISFLVPALYTGVAFDSGGVASGPMTTTFILPFAVGASEALGGNVLTDAFGVVAMVAMTPLITIQLMGLASGIRGRRLRRRINEEFSHYEDCILYFDEEAAE